MTTQPEPRTAARRRLHKHQPTPNDPGHCRKCGLAWWAIVHQKYERLSV